jgi:hypothetical protein
MDVKAAPNREATPEHGQLSPKFVRADDLNDTPNILTRLGTYKDGVHM